MLNKKIYRTITQISQRDHISTQSSKEAATREWN